MIPSSRKYDPGCLFRIPDLDFSHPGSWFFPSWIQSSKKHRIPDPQHCRQCSKTDKKYHVREGRSIFYRQESIEVGWFLVSLRRIYVDVLKKIVYPFLHRHCNQNTGSPPAMIVKKLCVYCFLLNNEKLIYIYQPWKWYKNEFSSTILQSSLLLALTCSCTCQTNKNLLFTHGYRDCLMRKISKMLSKMDRSWP